MQYTLLTKWGDEMILLIEDEPGVRVLTELDMTEQGYTVLEAGDDVVKERWEWDRKKITLDIMDTASSLELAFRSNIHWGRGTMDLKEYTGRRPKNYDPKLAAILWENSSCSMAIYRQGSVDWEFFNNAVVLCDATEKELYSNYTPLENTYRKGSRPFLERVVSAVTAGLKTDREKAIALNDWVRLLPVLYPNGGHEPFHGGTEEEVIKKGSDMCNEMARVLIVLAQIAGIPSRYIGHMTMLDFDNFRSGTGHGVAELHVDGAWAYFDIRGKFFQKRDGALASTWDLINDPSIMDDQPEEVVKWRNKSTSLDGSKRLLSKDAVQIVLNYFAADHEKYDYSWTYCSKGLWQRGKDVARHIRVTEHVDILPQPRPRLS